MDDSTTLGNCDKANGSDESPLFDLNSLPDLFENSREHASIKSGELSGEASKNLVSGAKTEAQLSVPPPAGLPTNDRDALYMPSGGLSFQLSSTPVVTVSKEEGNTVTEELAERTPTSADLVSGTSQDSSPAANTALTGAQKKSSPGLHKQSQGSDEQNSSRISPKDDISQRAELSLRRSGSPTEERQERTSVPSTKPSEESVSNKPSGAFAKFPTTSENVQSVPILRPSVSQDELQTTASSSLSSHSRMSEPSSTVSEISSLEETPSGTCASLPAVIFSSDIVLTSSTIMTAEPILQIYREHSVRNTHEAQGTQEVQCAQNVQDAKDPKSIRDVRDGPAHLPLSYTLQASPKSSSRSKRAPYKIRPKSSIPLDLTPQEYAGQCIAAAESSRLNPYALHDEEHTMLRQHISHAQVTTYLNIRNGILRLWLRKPYITITRNEAMGCAKETRWFEVASVCFDWLVRCGYVNYGCVEIKESHKDRGAPGSLTRSEITTNSTQHKRKKTIAVIGAGMAGLGCARQLHNLFKQYSDRFIELGMEVPDVVVLEGRGRIGGRVYSRAFQVQTRHRHPDFHQSRCTAEMGGMIVTGFDRGNPMNTLVRGQLGLGYHALLSTTTIYDINGKPVDAMRDGMVENLFNECLDRVSEYKFKMPMPKAIEGNHDHMDEGRDSPSDGHITIASVEESEVAKPPTNVAAEAAVSTEPQTRTESQAPTEATKTLRPREAANEPHPMLEAEVSPQADLVPVSSDRLTGRAHLEPGTLATLNAAHKVKIMGWALKPGVFESRDLDLDPAAKTSGATLGFVIEDAIRQYGELVDLNAQDFRLLNWHIANLEYSNAINHNRLSLLGWDIDAGNEWEGKHSMIIGGYQSVPRGLMLCPTPLDVRRQMAVKKITYSESNDSGDVEHTEARKLPVVIEFEHGDTFEADYVVNTIPLGVLKHGNVEFNPPLPKWKADSIDRLGFGVLNKIILTYRQPFWDTERDIFGVLREPANRFSLDQKEYSQRRGRMFQWFNVSKTTGIPCLVALMAGDAAFDTEKAGNDELVDEATNVLRSVFGARNVPEPIEAVVTRWASDKFSRGSYSSAGPGMKFDDYDTMARPVGKYLHFAGEHTIGTHPATVHGAYLSGLRAASEIFEELVGPIKIPTPLISPKETLTSAIKRKLTLDEDEGKAGDESSGSISANGSGSGYREAKASSRRRLEAREMRIQQHIYSQIGNRPLRPQRVNDTSYLLFSKANYEQARKKCGEGRRPGKGRPLPNEVRVLTSKMWRSASAEERRPFAEQAAAQKQMYEVALKEYTQKAVEWDQRAAELRAAYETEHPKNGEQDAEGTPQTMSPSVSDLATATSERPSPFGGRRLRQMASYQTGDDSDVDMSG